MAVGNVYSWNGKRLRHAGGSGFAITIEEHQSQLYEGGVGGVNKFTTRSNQYVGEVIRRCPDGRVTSLCSHDGMLFHAVAEHGRYEILNTFSGEAIAQRSDVVTLESHNGRLYDAGEYGLFDTLAGSALSERPCLRLCSHAGTLYGCNYGTVYDALSSDTRNKVLSRQGFVVALCSHNGDLIHADQCGSLFCSTSDTTLLHSAEFSRVTKYHVAEVGVTDLLSSTSDLLR